MEKWPKMLTGEESGSEDGAQLYGSVITIQMTASKTKAITDQSAINTQENEPFSIESSKSSEDQAQHRKKTTIADLSSIFPPHKTEATGTVDFETAAKMITPSSEPYLEGYICSLADCQTMIALITENGSNIMVRIPPAAMIMGEKKFLQVSTARVGHPIRLYHIHEAQLKMKNQPTLSGIRYFSRLFSVVGSIRPLTPTIAMVVDGYKGKMAKLVSGLIPEGTRTSQPMDNRGTMANFSDHSSGILLYADAYELPPYTEIIKNPDCDIVIRDFAREKKLTSILQDGKTPKNPTKHFALTNLRRLELEEIDNIKHKCQTMDRPTSEDLELYIEQATATLAAYYVLKSNMDREEAIINKILKFKRDRVFTASWQMEQKCITNTIKDKFATDETIEVIFGSEGSLERYKLMATITTVRVRQEMVHFSVEFSPKDTTFLEKWTSHPNNSSRPVTLAPIKSKEESHSMILNTFEQLPSTRIVDQFLGRSRMQTNQAIISEGRRQVGSIKLDESQTTALSRIIGSTGISIVIAPPGSGRKRLISAITRDWIASGSGSGPVIITSPTNLNVHKALEVLQSSVTSDDIRSTRIASNVAVSVSTEEEQRHMSCYQAQRFEKFITDPNQIKILEELKATWEQARSKAEDAEEPKEMLTRYAMEKKARSELTHRFEMFYQPNVVAITAAMLLRTYNEDTAEEVTKMIIDEAARLRPSDLLAILCKFRNLKSLILIGDPAQLIWHFPMSGTTDAHNGFHHSDMARLDQLHPEDSVRLSTVYRGHPAITRQLVAPNYPFDIKSGIIADQRTLANRLGLPRTKSGSPIQFIYVNGREVDGENREEAEAIKQFVKMLLAKGLRPEDLLILVHHRNQLELIKSIITKVDIKTVDAAQDHQASVVIVATTKTSHGSDAVITQSLRFIGNKNRATVAVSRAREAIYIFGDLKQLEKTDFWRPLIEIARKDGGIVQNSAPNLKRKACIN